MFTSFKGKEVPQSGTGVSSDFVGIHKKKQTYSFKSKKKKGFLARRRKRAPWSVHIKKLALKTTESEPDLKVKRCSKDALNILDSMCSDLITRLGREAKGIAINTQTRKLNVKAIYSAAKLMTTPENFDRVSKDMNLTLREFATSVQQAKERRHVQKKEEEGSRPMPEGLRNHRDKKRKLKADRQERLQKMHSMKAQNNGQLPAADEPEAHAMAEPVVSPADAAEIQAAAFPSPASSPASVVASPASVSSLGKHRRLRKAADIRAEQMATKEPTASDAEPQSLNVEVDSNSKAPTSTEKASSSSSPRSLTSPASPFIQATTAIGSAVCFKDGQTETTSPSLSTREPVESQSEFSTSEAGSPASPNLNLNPGSPAPIPIKALESSKGVDEPPAKGKRILQKSPSSPRSVQSPPLGSPECQ